jgi:DNA-binding NtrC family response regulator
MRKGIFYRTMKDQMVCCEREITRLGCATNLEALMPRPQRGDSRLTDPPKQVVPSRKPRILVADDESGIRLLVSTVLTRAGFHVEAVSDGQQAWEAMRHEHYDLLVTDKSMPRLGGAELIERMQGAGMSTPVIIISGAFCAERVGDSPPRQVVAVLTKPFGIVEFLNAVRDAVQVSGGDTTADQETFHRLHADPQPLC